MNGSRCLQADLDKVVEWAVKWKMEFNIGKCKIMHLGHNNLRNSYNMGDISLEATDEEKDLGVLNDNQLDFGKHIKTIVTRANRVLGLIRVSFACMNKPMFLNLYTALVRPLLEYCVQVWSPYKRKHIRLLEGVQRRATRLVPQLRGFNYDDRLEIPGIPRLVDRRIRGDMIDSYKIPSGKEKVDPGKKIQMNTFRGRSHSKKVFMKYPRLNNRKYWFTQRVVKKWNKLSSEEVEATTTSAFKKEYGINEAKRIEKKRNDIYMWG